MWINLWTTISISGFGEGSSALQGTVVYLVNPFQERRKRICAKRYPILGLYDNATIFLFQIESIRIWNIVIGSGTKQNYFIGWKIQCKIWRFKRVLTSGNNSLIIGLRFERNQFVDSSLFRYLFCERDIFIYNLWWSII